MEPIKADLAKPEPFKEVLLRWVVEIEDDTVYKYAVGFWDGDCWRAGGAEPKHIKFLNPDEWVSLDAAFMTFSED